jgi:HK97 family phage major capsid protein
VYDDDEAGAEWVGETAAPTNDDTPKVGKWRIPVHEMATKPKATQQLLEDAAVNVEQWLAGKVARKFTRSENSAFVNGDGVARPRGFLTYGAGSSASAYERNKIWQRISATSGVVAFDDLINLFYDLKGEYRVNSVWAMNRLAYGTVRKLKDSDGRYLWEPSLQVGQPSSLLGRPTTEMNDMPDITNSSLSIALADWAEAYQIVDRMGIAILRDPYSSKPFVEFYTRRRVGGAVVNFDAIKILKTKA